MLNRFLMLALAAAALGTAALDSASAHTPQVTGLVIHPNKPMGVAVNPHPVLGLVVRRPPVLGVVVQPHPPVLGVVVHPHPPMGVIVQPQPPHFVWWHHHRGPEVFEEGGATRVSAPVTTLPAAPCNCLTKQYLQDGGVLFKDVCTREEALASVDELKAQLQGGSQVR
jgi:hypothetical protein